MRITSKGRITIPKRIREEAGLLPGTEISMVVEQDGVRIIKLDGASGLTRGQIMVERLQRAGRHVTMSTDEIMALMRGE